MIDDVVGCFCDPNPGHTDRRPLQYTSEARMAAGMAADGAADEYSAYYMRARMGYVLYRTQRFL